MYTYIFIAVPFLATVFVLDWYILKTRVVLKRETWVVMAAMLGFTLVFDQFFTGLPIVTYDYSLTTGLKLFFAPIEDFTYTIAAVIGIGAFLQYVTHQKQE